MNFRARRDLWALARRLERSAAADDKLRDLTRPHAGHAQTNPPKGIQGGDEGWGELFELSGSSTASRDAARLLRLVLLRHAIFDPKTLKAKRLRARSKS